jgi:hypothetical protein
MKKTSVAVLFCLISSIVYAAQAYKGKKEVVCSSLKDLVEFVSGQQFQEEPYWIGSDQSSKFVMMVNEKTGTWTMIQYDNKKACIIGTGVKSQPVFSQSNSI